MHNHLFEDTPSEIQDLIFILLSFGELLRLAGTARYSLKTISEYIFHRTGNKYQAGLEAVLQYNANENNLMERLQSLSKAPSYIPTATATHTALTANAQFLMSEQFEQKLFNKVILTTFTLHTCSETIRCLAPIFMSYKERLQYRDMLVKRIESVDDKSIFPYILSLNNLVAVTVWLKADAQNQFKKNKYGDQTYPKIFFDSLGQSSSIPPSFLMTDVKYCDAKYNELENTFRFGLKQLLNPSDKIHIPHDLIPKLKYHINIINRFFPILTVEQIYRFTDGLVRVATQCNLSLPKILGHIMILNILSTTLNSWISYLINRFPGYKTSKYGKLIELRIQPIREFIESGFYGEISNCAQDLYLNSNLQLDYFHRIKRFMKTWDDLIFLIFPFPDPEGNIKFLPEPIDITVQQAYLKRFLEILIALTQSDEPNIQATSYHYMIRLNLVTNENKDMILADLLKINDGVSQYLFSSIKYLVLNFQYSDNQAQAIINRCNESLSNFECDYWIVEECLAAIDLKYPKLKVTQSVSNYISSSWKNRVSAGDKSPFLYFICNSELDTNFQGGDDLFVHYLQSRIQIVKDIHKQLKIPFRQALALIASIRNQDEKKLTQLLSQIMSTSIKNCDKQACFTVFNTLTELINAEQSELKDISNKENLLYTLQAAFLNLLDDIVQSIPDCDKVDLLKEAKELAIIKNHISTNTIDHWGRTRGEQKIDEKIRAIEGVKILGFKF